jgi:recombination DNA repair RAD52 pathway protein
MANDLTKAQYDILMKPLNASRVKQRRIGNKTLSYLEAWDVRAHLTRLFGFGGFSDEILSCQLLYCDKVDGKANWDVSYQATMRLTVPQLGASWDDGAVGSAHLPDRGEALDNALKTAVSDALKRCAVNLGTQFGISLYNNGQLADVIKATLVTPGEPELQEADVAVDELGEVPPDEDDGQVSVQVDEATGEIIETDEDRAYDALLVALRALAREVDTPQRVLAVAALKDKADLALLTQTTKLPSGSEVTLSRLADMVASGAFLNGGDA